MLRSSFTRRNGRKIFHEIPSLFPTFLILKLRCIAVEYISFRFISEGSNAHKIMRKIFVTSVEA